MIILHAYSTKNSGDGLLVDLTKKIGGELNYDKVTKFVALDKDSFSGFETIHEPVIIKGSLLNKIKYSLLSVLNLFIKIDLYSGYLNVPNCSVVFAVGGGYMRGRTLIESIKTFLAHVPQLCWASRCVKTPVIYLPQSIGPFKWPLRNIVRNRLKAVDVVFARDDLTVRELNLENVVRVPDLAVQELAESYDRKIQKTIFDKVYLIARAVNVPGEKEYIKRIIALKNSIPNLEPLVQSEGRGNNDTAFYESIGWKGPFRKVKDVLSIEGQEGVVVSVRLHGSLQSLISGCPSIHLSYERKGFGAYSDLGIKEYCHGFKSFEPAKILSQIEELKKDSSTYWDKIDSNVFQVLEKRKEMIRIIRDINSEYGK